MDQRVTVLGLILKTCYRLRRHRLMGIPLDWLIIGLFLLVALVLFRLGEPAWALLLALMTVAGLLVILLSWRVDYLIFRPRTRAGRPRTGERLEPDREVRIRATGPFAVHGQERYLVEQSAVYTTPHSREHILMAEIEPTRLLLLGHSDPDAWGWWYQFFAPDTIESVQVGDAVHGWRVRPALKVVYWVEDDRQRRQQVETVLSFDSQECRALVWDDLTREQRESGATR
jgi:hypothetical protein